MTPEQEREALEEIASGALCFLEHLASKDALHKVLELVHDNVDCSAETFLSRLMCAVLLIRDLKEAPPWYHAASVRLSKRYFANAEEYLAEQN